MRYYKNAIDIPSPTIRHLESISRETGVFLVVGVIERDGGTLYCTVVFIDSDKGYVGKHRKLMPTAMERVIWGQGDASTLTVVDKTFGEGVQAKITATICWYGVFLFLTPLNDFHVVGTTGKIICRYVCVCSFMMSFRAR